MNKFNTKIIYRYLTSLATLNGTVYIIIQTTQIKKTTTLETNR